MDNPYRHQPPDLLSFQDYFHDFHLAVSKLKASCIRYESRYETSFSWERVHNKYQSSSSEIGRDAFERLPKKIMEHLNGPWHEYVQYNAHEMGELIRPMLIKEPETFDEFWLEVMDQRMYHHTTTSEMDEELFLNHIPTMKHFERFVMPVDFESIHDALVAIVCLRFAENINSLILMPQRPVTPRDEPDVNLPVLYLYIDLFRNIQQFRLKRLTIMSHQRMVNWHDKQMENVVRDNIVRLINHVGHNLRRLEICQFDGLELDQITVNRMDKVRFILFELATNQCAMKIEKYLFTKMCKQNDQMMPSIEVAGFSFHIMDMFNSEQLLNWIARMPNLRSLSLEMRIILVVNVDDNQQKMKLIRKKLMEKSKNEQSFSNVKKLRLKIEITKQYHPIVKKHLEKFMINHFDWINWASKHFKSVETLVVVLDPLWTRNDLMTHYDREIELDELFPKLIHLIIVFDELYQEIEDNAYNYENEWQSVYEQYGFSRANLVRSLTLSYLRTLNKMERFIPHFWPNLIELNLSVVTECQAVYLNFTDEHLCILLNRLPQLHTLRFIDIHERYRLYQHAMRIMAERAMKRKPIKPMIFSIPMTKAWKMAIEQRFKQNWQQLVPDVGNQWIRFL